MRVFIALSVLIGGTSPSHAQTLSANEYWDQVFVLFQEFLLMEAEFLRCVSRRCDSAIPGSARRRNRPQQHQGRQSTRDVFRSTAGQRVAQTNAGAERGRRGRRNLGAMPNDSDNGAGEHHRVWLRAVQPVHRDHGRYRCGFSRCDHGQALARSNLLRDTIGVRSLYERLDESLDLLLPTRCRATDGPETLEKGNDK